MEPYHFNCLVGPHWKWEGGGIEKRVNVVQ